MKKIFPNSNPGTIIKNLDFIFWDLIKQPNISISKENMSNDTSKMRIALKLIK